MKNETPITTKARTTDRSEDSVTKYGRACGRISFTISDSDGKELGFAWAEQNYSDQDIWTAYRWSDLTGPVILRCLLSRDEAIETARTYVEGR